MLENNNLAICRRLVRREFQFHKGRSVLLTAVIALVSMLCTFSFALGFMVRDGVSYSYQVDYGSTSHIIYEGLSGAQAAVIANHDSVRYTVRLRTAGVLSDDMLEYRNVYLAAADEAWAEATESYPVYGRMPEAEDEIALDEMTLLSLAIPRREGAEVTLRWLPADGGGERVDTFRLCGWWDSAMGYTESCAWVTKKTADRLCANAPDKVMLGVTLYRTHDLDGQAQELLREAGAGDASYTTNLAYNEARIRRSRKKAADYYVMNIAVAVCGIMMVYNIVRISVGQNVRFYGRVKSLGMSPAQVWRLLLWQAAYLCLPAIPIGWLGGFMLYAATAPYVLLGLDGRNPAVLFFSLKPFVCSALLTWLTTLIACILPARFASRISPVEAMRYTDAGVRGRVRQSKMSAVRRDRVSYAALSGIGRNKGKAVLTAVSMLVSLTLLCVLWTQYVSTDEEKYLRETTYCDYQIADASAAGSTQRYNPYSHSMTPAFAQAAAGHEAVTEAGVLRTMEVTLYADEDERAPIVESFEHVDEDGIVRKENMSYLPDWGASYENFRTTGEYVGIVCGVDGLAQSIALEKAEYVEGDYDAERFATGDYVIAAGASTAEFLSTLPVGSRVEFGGRSFEVMASVESLSYLMTGNDSRSAQFNITYYLPERTFEELYPDSGIRNILVNIDYNSQEEYEAFLTELVGDSGIAVTMRSDEQWNFKNALFHNYVIPMFVGTVLFVIAMLNLCNALVTGMLVRRKEMAVCESLGMTRAQMRRMAFCEGAILCVALTIFIIPSVAALTWLWTRWWSVSSASAWCVTWHFSLLPMWAAFPVILAAVPIVLLCCLHVIGKESVTRRLQAAERGKL